MKKFLLCMGMLLVAGTVLAASDEVFWDENVLIEDVMFENSATTTSLLIMANSLTESFEVTDDGSLTVFNSASFRVGSADSNVKTLVVKLGDTAVACIENSTTSESAVLVPADDTNSYHVYPATTTVCSSVCSVVSKATSLNLYPTCGAASCMSGYHLSGVGTSATCVVDSSGGGGGGGDLLICQTVANAASYNIYPLCGASSCNNGYVLKGTSSEAKCELRPANSSQTCNLLPGAKNYNNHPQCGAKTCQDGYQRIGNGASATCRVWVKSEEWAVAKRLITVSWATGYPLDVEIELLVTSSMNFQAYARTLGTDIKTRDQVRYFAKIKTLTAKNSKISMVELYNLNNFVVYGSLSTTMWVSGRTGWTQNERLYMLESYKRVYNRLPITRAEWKDLLLMANGEKPKQISKQTEIKAIADFRKVYKRLPVFRAKDQLDTRAFNFMSYSLRSLKKDSEKELNGIKTFQSIYKRNPIKQEDWDIVRAIAYSGANR